MAKDKQSREQKQITEIRLQLLRNGYHPIPTYGKVARVKGWQTQEFIAREMNEERIASWVRRYPDLMSTGTRLDNGLVVIDGDANDPQLSDAVYAAVEAHAPDIATGAPMRYGRGENKFALFARWGGTDAERFNRQASRYYCRPEELAAWHAGGPEPVTHKIEIFGGLRGHNGNSSRHFGVYGPHSHDLEGAVVAEYRWMDGGGLHLTPLAELPVLMPDQVARIIDDFDARAVALGWVPLTEAAGAASGVAYDITEATRFDTNKGGNGIDYEELCADYALHGASLRCSANFMPGRGDSGKREHCSVGDNNRHGCVGVYVHGDAVTHFPAELEPGRDQKILDAGPVLPIAELAPSEPAEPGPDTDLHDRAAWLVETRAYYEGGDTIVRIYADTLDCQTTPSAFHRRYRHMHKGDPAKPHKKPVFATDLWEMTPNRRNVAGVRMAPDRPFPLYEEAGRLLKNTYRRPVHHATDSTLKQAELIGPFVEFMERFVPEQAERDWLLDWMAHKWVQPAVPGTSIFFVADDEESVDKGTFGTGRGLMSRIVRKLYGEQYCRAQSFSMLDGTSGQSQFNDWLHGSVLVTVDEAKTSPTAYRRGERNAAYEVLKDIVDPAPKLHTFKGKYRQAFDGMSYCSIWVFTNHGDALSIPEHDRRFTILRNGRQITEEEVKAIVAWMEAPGAIAALAGLLEARDLSAFNMFAPLVTGGKAAMAEQSISDVEDMLRDIMEDTGRGMVFTKRHIEMAIEHNYNGQGSYWRGEFQGLWGQYCVGLKAPSGGPRRARIFGTQKKLFCFRTNLRNVRAMPEAAVQRQIAKWGGGDPLQGLAETKGLEEKDE